MTAERSAMVASGEGEVVLRGGVGAVRKISSAADGAFSVVEHEGSGHGGHRNTAPVPLLPDAIGQFQGDLLGH